MGGSPGAAGWLPPPPGAGGVPSRRLALTTLLMNVASVVERADEGILPAVYIFIGKSLGASLSQLGTLTLCRAVFQALTSPISGVLGDRFDRTWVVAFGCALWGVMTSAIGLSTSLSQAMVSCAVNGFGLALVIPCVSSMVADLHPPDTRGNAFGMMSLTASLGGMAGAFFATNVGGTKPFGVEGWRFAFHLVAAVSLCTSFLVWRYAVDPRHLDHHPSLHGGSATSSIGSNTGGGGGGDVEASSAGGGGGGGGGPLAPPPRPGGVDWRRAWRDAKTVLAIRSFQILVLQGIVGSMPWVSLSWLTTYLQLLGFSDLNAASLSATFGFGCACGSLLGGTIGDKLGRRLPNSPNGRVLTNQFSVLVGLPLSFLVLKGLPSGGDMAPHYSLFSAVLFVYGLSISWCGVNNSAIFSELVPEEQRSTIYSWDRSFEGAVGAMGAPLVGLTAERLFGFQGALAKGGGGAAADAGNVRALSNALLVCMLAPWTLCLLFFTCLHWTFREDRRKLLRGGGEELVIEARPLVETELLRKRGTESAAGRAPS